MNGEFIFETITAYQRSEALKAAVQMDLFTVIADGARTTNTLSQKCNVSERGVRILCDYLVSYGLLIKDRNEYNLTIDANLYLNQNSPSYFGSSIQFWFSRDLKQAFENLQESVQTGGTALGDKEFLKPEHPIWVEFAKSMMPMMVFPAKAIAKLVNARAGHKWKVLDIAAGHGLFGIEIAKQNPNSQVTAVDWPSVLRIASENAKLAGVEQRYIPVEGSVFDVDLGSGYDLVLLTNFLHHFDASTCRDFLREIYGVMNPGGKVITLDFVANEDRVTPRSAAGCGLLMLATTPSGDVYTFSEYEEMFRSAGFVSSVLKLIPPAIQQVIISLK